LGYTNCVLKNINITVSEEAARWVRRKASEENISVSRLVGRMLEDQMRQGDLYSTAYARWKQISPVAGFSASSPMTREEAHERRR
jgi:hypothetical protein